MTFKLIICFNLLTINLSFHRYNFFQTNHKFTSKQSKNNENKFSLKAQNVMNTGEEPQYIVSLLRTIDEIPASSWNKCLDDTTSPFLDHSFLSALESSKCVSIAEGWDPVHLVISTANSSSLNDTESELNFVSACPLYVKYHSYGEFIFDQQWAAFAEDRLRLKYYPKVSY